MSRPTLKATVRDKKGRVIATAVNSYRKTHPIQQYFAKLCGVENRAWLHAEIAALLKCKEVVPHSIHIERYWKDGTPALAAPCPICVKAIKAWGVKYISYTV